MCCQPLLDFFHCFLTASNLNRFNLIFIVSIPAKVGSNSVRHCRLGVGMVDDSFSRVIIGVASECEHNCQQIAFDSNVSGCPLGADSLKRLSRVSYRLKNRIPVTKCGRLFLTQKEEYIFHLYPNNRAICQCPDTLLFGRCMPRRHFFKEETFLSYCGLLGLQNGNIVAIYWCSHFPYLSVRIAR